MELGGILGAKQAKNLFLFLLSLVGCGKRALLYALGEPCLARQSFLGHIFYLDCVVDVAPRLAHEFIGCVVSFEDRRLAA